MDDALEELKNKLDGKVTFFSYKIKDSVAFITVHCRDAMIDKGIDGIECFSPCVQQETISSLLKIARENKLLITCGSDYHGPTKQDRKLGVTHCPEKGVQLVRILTKHAN